MDPWGMAMGVALNYQQTWTRWRASGIPWPVFWVFWCACWVTDPLFAGLWWTRACP